LQNAKNNEVKNLVKIFEVKVYKNIRISDTKPNSVSTSTWLCVTSNMKNLHTKRDKHFI